MKIQQRMLVLGALGTLIQLKRNMTACNVGASVKNGLLAKFVIMYLLNFVYVLLILIKPLFFNKVHV